MTQPLRAVVARCERLALRVENPAWAWDAENDLWAAAADSSPGG